ncbi:MAG: hypothetical protein KDD84_20470 [Caldilineaceae bacterium]|nr:hypothetical protein [Caldilineaceae bacterium]
MTVLLAGIALLVFEIAPPAFAEAIDTVYVEPPDVARCQTGVLADAEKEAVLAIVNRIRALHGLAPVTYAAEHDDEVMESSLIIAANNDITHFPAADSVCYSEDGARGAALSNLAWSYPADASVHPLLAPSSTDVRNWLIDPGVADLGHRRWLLDPFLQEIAYGRVDAAPHGADPDMLAHGAALKVQNGEAAVALEQAPAFVAYPFGDYPLDLFEMGWFWSFSVVADPSDFWANSDVDFADVVIRVSGPAGDLTVRDVAADNSAVGLPNLLQWKVDGARMDEEYAVEITGIRIGGEEKRFQYRARLTSPDFSDLAVPVYTLEPGDSVVEIRSGQEFALYAPPPSRIPNQYTISRRGMNVQMAEHSPYVRLIWVSGSIGDEVVLSFGASSLTLRISETVDGVRNPLIALRRDLSMPVYKFAADGVTYSAAEGSQFAVYVPPAATDRGVQRVEWTQSVGSRFAIEFYSSRVLLVRIESGLPGDSAVVQVGDDQSFTVEVRSPRR